MRSTPPVYLVNNALRCRAYRCCDLWTERCSHGERTALDSVDDQRRGKPAECPGQSNSVSHADPVRREPWYMGLRKITGKCIKDEDGSRYGAALDCIDHHDRV